MKSSIIHQIKALSDQLDDLKVSIESGLATEALSSGKRMRLEASIKDMKRQLISVGEIATGEDLTDKLTFVQSDSPTNKLHASSRVVAHPQHRTAAKRSTLLIIILFVVTMVVGMLVFTLSRVGPIEQEHEKLPEMNESTQPIQPEKSDD